MEGESERPLGISIEYRADVEPRLLRVEDRGPEEELDPGTLRMLSIRPVVGSLVAEVEVS